MRWWNRKKAYFGQHDQFSLLFQNLHFLYSVNKSLIQISVSLLIFCASTMDGAIYLFVIEWLSHMRKFILLKWVLPRYFCQGVRRSFETCVNKMCKQCVTVEMKYIQDYRASLKILKPGSFSSTWDLQTSISFLYPYVRGCSLLNHFTFWEGPSLKKFFCIQIFYRWC